MALAPIGAPPHLGGKTWFASKIIAPVGSSCRISMGVELPHPAAAESAGHFDRRPRFATASGPVQFFYGIAEAGRQIATMASGFHQSSHYK
ncbi:hypothetical protein ACWDRB_27945 [Nonomuraea sp. NPDC003707]